MYKNINFEQAKNIIDAEETIILDVRTEEEFVTGHIVNAINIPVDELEERQEEIAEKQSVIMVYCKSGRRSIRACEILSKNNFSNVYNLGGVIDWPYGLEI